MKFQDNSSIGNGADVCSQADRHVCFFLAQQPPSGAMTSSFTRFIDHTERRTAVGRTPLDE